MPIWLDIDFKKLGHIYLDEKIYNKFSKIVNKCRYAFLLFYVEKDYTVKNQTKTTEEISIMSQDLTRVIEEHFKSLPDPRRRTMNLRHNFIDILIIAICAIICSADSWVAVEEFGIAKEAWFRSFLELPNGSTEHDTFTNVFRKLASKQFEVCFISWTESISEVFDGEVVAVDGKTLRRSHDASFDKKAIHMVSAQGIDQFYSIGADKN